MRKQASRRNALAIAMTLVTFSLGVLVSVFVAGSASASGPLPTTTTTSTASPSAPGPSGAMDLNSPQAQFLVINGTVNAASDHEIVGSSAFPNYTTGAVDNYYSMSRSHMDNSPFNEALASPFDTGPVGQTAAAGNFQQPQYADARWPGGPETMTYGSDRKSPFAEVGAYPSVATADASEPSNGLSAPKTHGTKNLPVPKGFDSKLQRAIAGWKSKYLNCPAVPKKPAPPKVQVPKPPKVPVPKPPKVPIPSVTTPVVTVAAPHTDVGGAPATPSVQAPPAPAVPSPGAARSLSSVPSPCAAPSGSGSDGESLLTSSALSVLVPGKASSNDDLTKVDTKKLETTPTTTTTETTPSLTATTPKAWKPKPYTLLMGGESRMGRVTLGNGQIVIEGIHVKASIANDGTSTPTYKANISVASASIGGVPVTIDQDGVHLAGHDQGVPYQQASDGLNGALKQAGIQIFLAAPQVTNCAQTGAGTSTDSSTTTTTTDTTSSTTTDQSGTASQCGQAAAMCDPGMGTGTGTDTTSTTTTTSTSPTSTDQSGMGAPPASCPPPPCGSGATTGSDSGTGTTTTGPTGGIGGTTTTTTTTSTGQTDTTSTTSSFCPPTMPPPAGCAKAGAAPSTSTNSATQPGAPAPGATDPSLMALPSSGQETIVTATGVHVVFTQPVSPSGVPAQFMEHILGEVYIDSLAAPATPIPALGLLGSSSSLSSSSSSCGGRRHSSSSSLKSGGGGGGSSTGGGTSLAGGSATSGSGSIGSSGSALGATSPTIGSTTGSSSFPASIAAALKKPLWLLLAYLVWQALVIGTGWSLWNWRKEGPSA